MSKLTDIEKEIKEKGHSDLYGVLRDTIDLLHFTLCYINSDMTDSKNERNQNLLQMNTVANEVSMLVNSIVLDDIKNKLIDDKSDIDIAYKIYLLQKLNDDNTSKKRNKVFEQKLSKKEISMIEDAFNKVIGE